jgi:hypothetical protein
MTAGTAAVGWAMADRNQVARAGRWLRLTVAAGMMAGSLVYGLSLVGAALAHLPDAVRRGDLMAGLGVLLVATLAVALFSIGAALWSRARSTDPAAGAAWQRAFQVACGLAVGLMLLILATGVVPKL